MPEIIQIPTERHAQLKALASKLGLTINDTLGHLIRQEIAKGTIPDTIPGFVLEAASGGVQVGFENEPFVSLTRDAALSLADTIETIVRGDLKSILNADAGLIEVTRVGTGIKIALFHGGSRVVSRDVARDIAGIVRRAADRLPSSGLL